MNEYYKKFEKFDKGNCSTVVIGKDASVTGKVILMKGNYEGEYKLLKKYSKQLNVKTIEKFNYFILSIIVVVLMFLSIIPLTKIKDVKIEDKNKTLDVMKTFPKRNYIFIVLDQLRYIIITLFMSK